MSSSKQDFNFEFSNTLTVDDFLNGLIKEASKPDWKNEGIVTQKFIKITKVPKLITDIKQKLAESVKDGNFDKAMVELKGILQDFDKRDPAGRSPKILSFQSEIRIFISKYDHGLLPRSDDYATKINHWRRLKSVEKKLSDEDKKELTDLEKDITALASKNYQPAIDALERQKEVSKKLNEARDFVNQGNYKEAEKIYTKLGEKGVLEANYNILVYSAEGGKPHPGININFAKAAQAYERIINFKDLPEKQAEVEREARWFLKNSSTLQAYLVDKPQIDQLLKEWWQAVQNFELRKTQAEREGRALSTADVSTLSLPLYNLEENLKTYAKKYQDADLFYALGYGASLRNINQPEDISKKLNKDCLSYMQSAANCGNRRAAINIINYLACGEKGVHQNIAQAIDRSKDLLDEPKDIAILRKIDNKEYQKQLDELLQVKEKTPQLQEDPADLACVYLQGISKHQVNNVRDKAVEWVTSEDHFPTATIYFKGDLTSNPFYKELENLGASFSEDHDLEEQKGFTARQVTFFYSEIIQKLADAQIQNISYPGGHGFFKGSPIEKIRDMVSEGKEEEKNKSLDIDDTLHQ